MLLVHHGAGATIRQMIATYRPAVAETLDRLRQGHRGIDAVTALVEQRASVVAAIDLVDLSRACDRPLPEVANALHAIAAEVDLDWLATAVNRLPAGNRWQARARAHLAADLARLRLSLLRKLFANKWPVTVAARAVLDEIKHDSPRDLAMLSAGLAEIGRLLTS
jgi:NAD-specific glutamate dehydrogenase